MKIYYKATKPDGFDFYSGTVDYAGALVSGKPVTRKPVPEYGFECCSDTVYHAADAAAETLIGCKWPCRLFEVSGKPVAQRGHKFGFRSLRVLREIPAHLALGPQGEEVAALIDQASRVTYEQSVQLDAARDAAWDAARDAARDAGCAAVALLVRDLVSDDVFDTLYGPWASVMLPKADAS
jgi:hypothetical protein